MVTVILADGPHDHHHWYHLWANGGTMVVEHSEFDGLNTSTMGDDNGIAGDNVTVRWSRFIRLVNGMNLGSDSLAEHNLIEQPNTAYAGAHSDGIEVYGGSHLPHPLGGPPLGRGRVVEHYPRRSPPQPVIPD